MKEVRIYPFDAGTLLVEKSILTPAIDVGVKVVVPSLVYYVDGLDAKILVDTGFENPELMTKLHFSCSQTPDQEIPNLLRRINLTPEDIDIVIATHLHWDHCGNHKLFKNARIIVQREELAYAMAPLPMHLTHFDPPSIGREPFWLNTRFETIDGDKQISKGVQAIFTPGHSYGLQSVVVETKGRRYVITSDAVPLYENWAGNNFMPHIPPRNYDAKLVSRSLEKIEEFADFVLPGHDKKVLEKEYYS